MLESFDLSLFLKDLFMDLGLGESLSIFLRTILIGLIVLLLSWLAYIITRFIIDRVIVVVVRKTRFTWDDIFLETNVFSRLSHFAPAIVIWAMAGWVLDDYPGWLMLVQKLTYLYMIVASILFLYSFIDAWHKIYSTLPIAEHRNIKGYVQLVKIIITIVALILTIALLSNKEIGVLVAGLGAMAAVLILVFKDTILGLVASIQLSANKMVKVGDWIVLPSRGTDGTVIDISLNTVKVQNWDKTITTVPTYALVQESFHNWKGMEESGGRRIKRAINLDMKSVKFIDRELRKKLGKIRILKEYLERKESELNKYNAENGIDDSVLINGRRMTNLGTFRAYVEAYLHHHPKIHNDMTFLVRQLHPSDKGLPLEIYVFSNDQKWANYEAIQSDIFDHLLAVIPEFDLRVFQSPTGDDFKLLIKP